MRSTRACDVRAPRRAGWSQFVPYRSPLCQRDGRLPRCTAVLRRASPGLQRAGYLRMCASKSSPNRARSLSLSEGSAARALATFARLAALVGIGSYPMKAHCASGTAVSLGARSCSDVRAAASNEQLTCACAQVKAAQTARALSLSRKEAQHARLRRARATRRAGWSQPMSSGSPLCQ